MFFLGRLVMKRWRYRFLGDLKENKLQEPKRRKEENLLLEDLAKSAQLRKIEFIC